MKRLASALFVAALYWAGALSASAQTEASSPIMIRSPDGRGAFGQGMAIRGRSECLIVTVAHVLAGASEVQIWTDDGVGRAETVYVDPDIDYALLRPVDPIATCPAPPSTVAVERALSVALGHTWFRVASGSRLTRAVVLAALDDRTVNLSASDSLRSVQRGMSGAPVIFDRVPVGLVRTAEETGGQSVASVLRLDYIAKLAGTRLSPPDPPSAAESAAAGRNARAQAQDRSDIILAGAGLFSWPVVAREVHATGAAYPANSGGLLLGVGEGETVTAAAAGTVAYVGHLDPYPGKVVLIRHSDQFFSAYANLDQVFVDTSWSVRSGDGIGTVVSGAGQPDAVYFEIRYQAPGSEDWTPAPVLDLLGEAVVSPGSGSPLPPPLVAPRLDGRHIIMIDPGHGGRDPGATGASSRESDVNLAFSLELKRRLDARPGIEVILTRETEVEVPLSTRISLAGRAFADIFLSIHFDAGEQAESRGSSVYLGTPAQTTWKLRTEHAVTALFGPGIAFGGGDGRRFSDLVIKELEEADIPTLSNPQRTAALTLSTYPIGVFALLELGFITNEGDEARLADPVRRAVVVEAVARAIEAHFAEADDLDRLTQDARLDLGPDAKPLDPEIDLGP